MSMLFVFIQKVKRLFELHYLGISDSVPTWRVDVRFSLFIIIASIIMLAAMPPYAARPRSAPFSESSISFIGRETEQ